MNSLTNIEVYECSKKQKPNSRPNFDDIADVVNDKLQLSKSIKSKVQ